MRIIRRYLRLYLAYARVSLGSNFLGKSVFVVNMLGLALNVGSYFVYLLFLYGKIDTMAGWTMEATILIFAVQSICSGVMELAFGAIWGSGTYLVHGQLDMQLLRPVGVLFQVANGGGGIGNTNFLGPLSIGIVLLVKYGPVANVHWSLFKGVVFAGLVISGCLIRFAVALGMISVAFWTREAGGIQQIADDFILFSRYPLTAYGKTLEFVLTWILPYGFYGFYPALFLIGTSQNPWLAYVAPVIAIVFYSATHFMWTRGLRRYQSAGG